MIDLGATQGAGVSSSRKLGSATTDAAPGDHMHAGAYASTAHQSTHGPGESDALTSLPGIDMQQIDGTGFLGIKAQQTPVGPPATDDTIRITNYWTAWRPMWYTRSFNKFEPLDSIYGPEGRWALFPGSTTSLNTMFGTSATAGTISHAGSTALGYYANFATAASANATAVVDSVGDRWCRGDQVQPWLGFYFVARVVFPDASYNASGATTGSRIFIGLTNQTAATSLGSDNPAGHRIGFQRINVNGGKTQSNFFITQRDGTTEFTQDTGVALVQNNVYDFHYHMHANGSYGFWQIDNKTAGTSTGSMLASDNLPGNTTFMKMVCGISTINAVARNWRLRRICLEVPLD